MVSSQFLLKSVAADRRRGRALEPKSIIGATSGWRGAEELFWLSLGDLMLRIGVPEVELKTAPNHRQGKDQLYSDIFLNFPGLSDAIPHQIWAD